ncbi:MAG: MFS transporter [Bacteroidia bacterium]
MNTLFQKQNRTTLLLITVAALGYFVDIYDLILFNVVKKESLEHLGFTSEAELRKYGIELFNWQMAGMLIGGIIWGILGDKKGRIKVLFGSILMYSLANIANAFVTDIPSYAAVRFIAGVGLAGELGAGITLVAEVMSKETRGYGTMIIVTFGALGAVLAALVGGESHWISELTGSVLANWQIAYLVGGLLGMLLLVLRIGTLESEMYRSVHKASVRRGDFFSLFKNSSSALKYLKCILIGLPVWYAIGILISLAENFGGTLLNVDGKVVNSQAVMFAYLGLSVGDLISGFLSQVLKSRKKVVLMYLGFSAIVAWMYFGTTAGRSTDWFYFICFLVGAGTGFWALFVTMAAEQFGTNIRSTVTTTVPNFVRGSVIPITWGFRSLEPTLGTLGSAAAVGVICILLALWATMGVDETFGKELNYTEVM